MSKKLPSITSSIPNDLRTFIDRLREIVSSESSDRLVTVNDLTSTGILTSDATGNLRLPSASTVSSPVVATGLTVTSAIKNILLSWDSALYSGHAYTEVWGGSVDNIGQAVLLGQAPGAVYTDPIGPSATRYYWIRFVNVNDERGPYNAVSGTSATTAPDLEYTLDLLSNKYSTTSEAPFFQLDVVTEINGVRIPAGTYMKSAFIHDAVITNAKIADLAVDSAKVSSLVVDKLATGILSIDTSISSSDYLPGLQGWNIHGDGEAEFSGVVVRGTVYASDGTFTGEIIAPGTGGNKARMYSGNFEIYKDVPAVGTVLYKALSRLETGIGQNNVSVTIPGYFTTQPKIIVSIANMKLYDAAFAGQSQSVQCDAVDIVESSSGSMVWSFTPRATLSLAANTGQVILNESSGTVTGTWTSNQFTTVANTAAITGNLTLRSYRGTGVSGNYYYRTVRWRLQYWNGSAWVDSTLSTTNLGADVNAQVTTNITLTFPSAGAWLVRAFAEAYDTGGSFNVGTAYETATDSVSRSDYQTRTAQAPPAATQTLPYTPTYSIPAGWEYVSNSYTYIYSYEMMSNAFTSASITGGGLNISTSGVFKSGNNISKTYTGGLTLSFTCSATANGTRGGYATLEIFSLTGTVTRRRPLTNSTTAQNSFTFNYYNFNLTTAQVLAEGSLNWVAVGG